VKVRRQRFLKEMGLSPVWRKRGEASDATAAKLADAPQAVSNEATASIGSGTDAAALERRAAIMRMGWAELKQAVASCIACPLYKTRTRAVFGVGDEDADWLFVGEAPGAEEDAKGEPFVGQAGKLLDNMLKSIGLRRGENVYIANVLKSRPPGNRDPRPEEVAACEPYLRRQIELIRPKVIVALGRFAAATLTGQDKPLASLRGRVHDYQGIPLIVTYHPAYLLRNLPDKAKAWQDLCLARKVMEGWRPDREGGVASRSSA
jgi:DNA polymerase